MMAEGARREGGSGAERVGRFYRDFPEGSIRTFMVKMDGAGVVFEARVYRTPEEASMGVYTSGWALAGGAALEACESGAVSRALAHLGYADAGEDAPAPAGIAAPPRDDETLPLFAAGG